MRAFAILNVFVGLRLRTESLCSGEGASFRKIGSISARYALIEDHKTQSYKSNRGEFFSASRRKIALSALVKKLDLMV